MSQNAIASDKLHFPLIETYISAARRRTSGVPTPKLLMVSLK